MDCSGHVNPMETRRAVRRFFDDLACRWDAIIDPDHGRRLAGLLAGIEWSAPVLDVGAGTGILWEVLGGAGVALGAIVAIDISPRMLASPRSDPPRRVAADVHQLPFPDGWFGSVACNSCLPHFDQLDRALDELTRVLRPGGMFVACHSEPREVINRHHRQTGGVVGGHELPGPESLGARLSARGLTPEIQSDSPRGYLVTARKR
ncbi:MAG: class I SAM-dependent methyltransferase [Candidatus Hydrogenedentes bacterium]|nr:class I SAM-dependent methyltransferase [Candidatus Hydrogenedentota bacterium]